MKNYSRTLLARLGRTFCIVIAFTSNSFAQGDGWSSPAEPRDFEGSSESRAGFGLHDLPALSFAAAQNGGGFRLGGAISHGSGIGFRGALLWPAMEKSGLVGLTVRRQPLASDPVPGSSDESARADLWSAGLESDTFWNDDAGSSGWMLQGLILGIRAHTQALRSSSDQPLDETRISAGARISAGYQFVVTPRFTLQMLVGGGKTFFSDANIWDAGIEFGTRIQL